MRSFLWGVRSRRRSTPGARMRSCRRRDNHPLGPLPFLAQKSLAAPERFKPVEGSGAIPRMRLKSACKRMSTNGTKKRPSRGLVCG
jgi:hypothetical protein